MDENNRLREWWWRKQGFDGSLEGKAPADVLRRSGWARSVSGCGPYLTLFSRAGISRASADEAVAALEVHELPSARGCTYLLPDEDFALGLKVGQGFSFEPEMRVARKLGVTDKELENLCDAVAAALREGPLEPDELRATLGASVRHLGDAGKKVGMTTTLPLALGKLQEDGRIRRIAANGRLDQQRYRYALWEKNPLDGLGLNTEEAYGELARKFFNWCGPATLAEFQTFSGLGVKASKSAIEPLKLVAVGGDRLLLPADADEFDAFRLSRDPHYALVGALDSLVLLRRNLQDLLAEEDYKRPIAGEKKVEKAVGLKSLPSNAIFDRGRLIGLWEYDPQATSISWTTFVPRNRELEQAVLRTEEYVNQQLGDARSFSLDSPKSRAPRIEALRRAG